MTVYLAAADEVWDLLPKTVPHPQLVALHQRGWCVSPGPREVATVHSEDRSTSLAFWDLPGEMPPGWIQVALTECPGDPSDDPQVGWHHQRLYLCHHKHRHVERREVGRA